MSRGTSVPGALAARYRKGVATSRNGTKVRVLNIVDEFTRIAFPRMLGVRTPHDQANDFTA